MESDPTTNPFPVVFADFKKLGTRLQDAVTATENDQGETMEVVLEIPVEVGALAAWFDTRLDSYHDHTASLPTDIDIPPLEDDRERAQQRLTRILCEWFWNDYRLLNHGLHPILFKKPDEEATPDLEAFTKTES